MIKLKVGEYTYDSIRKVWTVRLEDTDVGDGYFDCETQCEAEVISRLIKLAHTKVKLEKVEQVQKKILKMLDGFLGKNIHPNLLELVKSCVEHEFKELIEE